MGILRWDLGHMDEAENQFREALTAFKTARDRRSQEFCVKCLKLIQLYNLGKDDRNTKLYHRSEKRFEEAIILGREIGFPDFALKCLRQQAMTFLDMRKLDLFLNNSIQGLKISEMINHRIEQGRCLNNIAVYFLQHNDFSQAVIHLERALSVVRKGDDKPTEAECLNNLGIVYRELGNMSRAEFYLSAALELDKMIGDVNSISTDTVNIGSVFLRRGIDEGNKEDLLRALEKFQECLLLQGRQEANSVVRFAAFNNMGIVFNELKNYDVARRQFERALQIAERGNFAMERCYVLCNMGASYLNEHKTEEALAQYRLSSDASSKNSLENVLMESCLGLGQCYEKKQDRATALDYYLKAIVALDNVRARIFSEPFLIGFARNKYGVSQKAIRLLADQYTNRPSPGLLSEIFSLVEKAKARAFLESVREAQINIEDSDLPILKERQQAISKIISELSRTLMNGISAGGRRDALKNELELEEEEYVRLISDIKAAERMREDGWREETCRLSDIQRLSIDEGAILLEYFLGEQESYLILISPASARLHVLPGRGKIESSLRAYLKLISDRSSDSRAGFAAAERIGQELLPLAMDETLRKASAIIVIPDGILHYLPFEAVRIRDESGSKYLIEQMTISYCPSASALAVLKSQAGPGQWKKDMLVVSGPTYAQKSSRIDGLIFDHQDRSGMTSPMEEIEWSALPFSEREVVGIAKLYPPGRVDVLVGAAADESAIKKLPLKEYRIIHFACHGILDQRYPFRSALILSSTDKAVDDGYLQTREIYGLAMNADLVVLSACQSSRGVLEGSEGPMTLARPFFFAGARSVIGSLWPINDKATVVLMNVFYRSLIGGSSTGEALRHAKNQMLATRWAHPYFWAGFMLEGNPSVVGMPSRPSKLSLN
jgi:CHAT domain-containing protein/Tfp pilus assembly protein PilF